MKINLEVKLAPVIFIKSVDEFEGVHTVSVHVPVAIGNAAIAELKQNLIRRLGSQGGKVPKHVCILQRKLKREQANHLIKVKIDNPQSNW